jgi:hypothetical protein
MPDNRNAALLDLASRWMITGMVPFDIQRLTKLEAATQQVEAAIELFYAKRYAPAITLAAAAEGCLRWVPPSDPAGNDDADLPGVEPWFEIIKRSAMEQFDEKESLVAERFNALVYWLKHKTDKVSATAEISNYDAWQMIVRAVTKIEAVHPGSETPAITAFIEFSRRDYSRTL